MPDVKNPELLKAVYAKAKAKIAAREIPTSPIWPGQSIFRRFDPAKPFSSLPKPAPGGVISRAAARALMIPADGATERGNRFSGPGPEDSGIPCAWGSYAALQQQAVVNESAHYNRRVHYWALTDKCVLRFRVTGTILVADLSPHNPGALRFFRELGHGVWERLNDLHDCSAARGIGLAVAESGFLKGICIQTVRESERSIRERGDNLVLFSGPAQPVPWLEPEAAYFFGKKAEPDIFRVV